MNHHATDHPAAWLLTDLAGIRIDQAHPGGKNLILGPIFPKNLAHAKGRMKTVPGGVVESAWRRAKGKVTWHITVPEKCVARPELVGWKSANQPLPETLREGKYTFELVESKP